MGQRMLAYHPCCHVFRHVETQQPSKFLPSDRKDHFLPLHRFFLGTYHQIRKQFKSEAKFFRKSIAVSYIYTFNAMIEAML